MPTASRPSGWSYARSCKLSVPRLEQFKACPQSEQAIRDPPVLPKSPLGAAISYCLNQGRRCACMPAMGTLTTAVNARCGGRISQLDFCRFCRAIRRRPDGPAGRP